MSLIMKMTEDRITTLRKDKQNLCNLKNRDKTDKQKEKEQALQDNNKRLNMHIIRVPEGNEKDSGTERVSEEENCQKTSQIW